MNAQEVGQGHGENIQPQVPVENIPFEGLPPQFVLDRLRKLTANDIIGGKSFWKSYEKWEKLGQQQRTNTVVFVSSKLTDVTRRKLYDDIRSDLANAVREEKSRQAYTNKHDKARLLHLRKDPKFAGLWQRALGDKSRVELDADHGQDEASCWIELASAFNDYSNNVYTNTCICIDKISPAGDKIAVPGLERIFEHCHDLDPSSANRPERDAKWIRSNYRDLKTAITLTSEKYRRSGNQNGEHEYDEWVSFSGGQDVVTYARALFNDVEMQQIGRAIRSDISRDTGALPKQDAITTMLVAGEKHAWKEGRQGKKRKAGCLAKTGPENERSNLSVASVLQATMTKQLLLEHGDQALRQRIINDLTMAYERESGNTRNGATPKQSTPSRHPPHTPQTITSSTSLSTSPIDKPLNDSDSERDESDEDSESEESGNDDTA